MRRFDVQPSHFVRVARPLRFPPGSSAGQRASERRDLRAVAEIRESGTEDAPLPLELSEVSATGAFIASDLLLPVGSAVEVKFTLPDGKSQIEGLGRITRVQDRKGRPGMGLLFERMSPGDRRVLREFTAVL